MFKRNQKPAHECQITYDDVVGYLRDLNQSDYTKILKVVKIYRDADKGVKKVLNIKEPAADEEGFTDEELDELFMLDEPVKKTTIKVTAPKSPNPSPSKGLKKAAK